MRDIKKYTWSTNINDEIWSYDTFDTIEECIEDAKKNHQYKPGEIIAVGTTAKFIPDVDAEGILERLAEDAYEYAGEAAEGWLNYTKEQIQALSDKLTAGISEWLKETGQEPHFYQINNIREVEITED